MSALKIYVPRDAAARSVGADATAHAIARRSGAPRASTIELIRNGSRGLLWLEPLVEVEVGGPAPSPTGPCGRAMSPSLFDAGIAAGGCEPAALRWLTGRPRRSPISSASSG